MNDYIIAFLLTLVAGLSIAAGSLITFLTRSTNRKFLSVSLGFAAGVMIYLSMMEILPEAQEYLSDGLGSERGTPAAVAAFFAGLLLMAAVDRLLESSGHSCDINHFTPGRRSSHGSGDLARLMKIGAFTALALAIHNFPEGLATFVTALQDINIALPIVVAIIIHNIPAGIAISVPIYHATGSKRTAFRYSMLSGLAEPAGALVGWLVLTPFMNDILFGLLFAGCAGVMIFISFSELLPSSRDYGTQTLSVYGLIIGMFVMAVSLLLLE